MKRHPHFFLILIPLLILSCEVRFAPDVRVQVKGMIISDTGEPISDAQISVYTRRSSGGYINAPGPLGTDDYLLGRNYSNQDGTFEVTSLFDRDEDFSIVVFNENNYTNYSYTTSTVDYVPENLTFDLETLTLDRVATIDYNFTRTSVEGNTFQYIFNFRDTACLEYYVEGVVDSGLSYCYQNRTLNRTLNDNRPDIAGRFSSPYATVVDFTYSINEQDPITQTFTIDQDNYEFTFSY
ncbi:hypothetical protein ES692_16865 [Psychroserpens burtonensis]|uniref:Carboxypeptidase regulatory-like domain-containing protein n=1 Tax=Psychroserpens burtonensis TaxID=49278 RepID=A0A5C7B3R3_9FLAO|nr:hypothetical protein [Psychroserpens burtonensis]TXE15403.1 hypothetical protein ES692_16865 [Psychroserpens burtonensis]